MIKLVGEWKNKKLIKYLKEYLYDLDMGNNFSHKTLKYKEISNKGKNGIWSHYYKEISFQWRALWKELTNK